MSRENRERPGKEKSEALVQKDRAGRVSEKSEALVQEDRAGRDQKSSEALRQENRAGVKQEKSESQLQIRRIRGRECLRARALWEEVFCEEEPAFTEYYFTEMAPANRGVVLEEDGEIQAMLYLSPNQMKLNGQACTASYLVGVATRAEKRHRGYMAALLREAFQWMREEKEPFAFLMPASPAIYEPFGFRYIFARPEWNGAFTELATERMEEAQAAEAAAFARRFLESRAGAYVERTNAYYERMELELAAQQGNVAVAKDASGEICAVALLSREGGETEVQELLAEPAWEAEKALRKAERTPVIMGRVMEVRSLLGCLRAERECCLGFRVWDREIPANCGLFVLEADTVRCDVWQQEGDGEAELDRKKERNSAGEAELDREKERNSTGEPGFETEGVPWITAEKLTQWVFGCEPAEHCFEWREGESDAQAMEKALFFQKLGLLRLPAPVWITEIV